MSDASATTTMPETTTTATFTTNGTSPTVTTPAPAPAPWYQGKADAEMIGYWQNKAWKHDDPITVALEATKAAREAQKFVGAPPELLVRLPKDAKDEAGWNNVYSRLGKPKEAKEYDFSSVKRADGTAPDETFVDMIRQTAFSNHLNKDAATDFARAVVKHIDQSDQSKAAEAKAKWDAGAEKIKQNWGPNFAANQMQALEGTRKLGVSQELYDAMAKAAGVDVVAELFRKIGSGLSEDRLVEGNRNGPTTQEAARARRTELMQDRDWARKYQRGDVQARQEMHKLNQIITGVVDTSSAA